ncbi:Transcriptional regulator, TetR family [Pseudonocardia sp. Ae406_Ps2]|uniref:TetR family transcriptional regulator n=1 Tax=unclassified Pseudonocardia TaxID=2619320 RepID=UPI00094AE3A4|nr:MULTISPECIES: TetR family transcriptional regulator [unclassified Pseudonocardia]OLM00333.1 Transcriptional regulator, TetR family [Pseudonocardia sp. Ae406_Ps2]OLM07876.1 Transcriptional regulator, TetR family [Pseudonocardia sp. Ae331_Ps2]OLM13874.1 Transcriptional regulator, TetR family [Pseudonocardia sp. Ae505_Ps2]OLM21902.1 Transcriptional regulator, TetR family [Pseudonocardia sp. Ae706_Ps2]OLM30991.1 Transcriptional regulator, TetR family [Pseudonocardia sp. Ae717_Ps2]
MAWDTEGTRRRLKDAATAEFAERGREGTTMSRIAARAGINKERLYSYFGDKQALWDLVLAEQLELLAAGVRATGTGLDDVGEFAGATFDHHADHPVLARLLQWEGLDATGHVAGRPGRSRHYREKVERFAAAQRAGTIDDGLDPAHLVFALIALAAWWHTVPQLASMVTGAEPGDPAERAARRAFVVEAARRLAAPRRSPDEVPGPDRG